MEYRHDTAVPRGREKTLAFASERSSGASPDQLSRLMINGKTGTSIKEIGSAKGDTGKKLTATSRLLHARDEFGIIGQAIAMLAFGVVFLVWTGFSMAWRRLSTKTHATPNLRAKSPDPLVAR